MENTDILIIGAGAAGLMAARILAKAGKKVIVLEARDRVGGRIHTLSDQSFLKNNELGAEFVHGNLPVTLGLLNEAGIKYHDANGGMWHYKNGSFSWENEMEGWGELMDKLNALKDDLSIDEFLEKEFAGDKYDDLKISVRKFVAGYDTADPADASTFALRKEWQSEDDHAQHRVEGGYGAMIKYLEDECKLNGGLVYLNSVVTKIIWSEGKVEAFTVNGKCFNAKRLILALPLGVLKADKGAAGALSFVPAIPEQSKALNSMGFGAIIKILLEFDTAFWEDELTKKLAGQDFDEMAFLLSDEEIPTWWTQVPQHSTVLTGWLGGPPAMEKTGATDEELLHLSLTSLSNIFKRDKQELKQKLVAFNIVNWTKDPFTRGSYAYDTVAAPEARKLLIESVDDTIYFAGEYLYEGPAMGTVEAALTSGREAAERIRSYKKRC